MRNLVLCTFLFLLNWCSAQSFSYRFKGQIDQAKMENIEKDITSNAGFSNIKFRSKEVSGEILFQYTSQPANKEEIPVSPAILLKGIILQNGLEPIELVQLP